VLVDGVDVEHVVLHLGDDPAEGRDEAAENARFVHPLEGGVGGARRGQDVDEQPVGAGVGAKPAVDPVEALGDEPDRPGMDGDAEPIGLKVEADQADGVPGYALAAAAFVITVLLIGNRRFPAALPVVGLGLVYAVAFNWDGGFAPSLAFRLPALHVPQPADILTGFLVLALPQIPLSLGNSVLATRQLAGDLFPARRLTIRKIGLTYALMNLVTLRACEQAGVPKALLFGSSCMYPRE